MFKKLVLGFMVATLTLSLFPILSASAVKPQNSPVSSTCEELSVNLTGYAENASATPGQPYIAPTYKTVTIPGIAAVTHLEYRFKKGQDITGWLLVSPGDKWKIHETMSVIDLAATPSHDVIVENTPGQPYIAPTAEKTNEVTVVIDGTTVKDTTFSTTYSKSFTYIDQYVAHNYSVDVTAWNGNGTATYTATSTPCDNLDHKITICHANNGIKQYVEQSVDFDSIIRNNGHSEHQDGRDIIPPFDYIKNGTSGHFAGLNWTTEGQLILEGRCITAPEKPKDIITVVPVVEIDCETKLATMYTVTTTIGHELVKNVWVPLAPVSVESESITRLASEAELAEAECITAPEKPQDVVTVKIAKALDCDTKTVIITTTTTTTGWELVDNKWIATDPIVTPVITERVATDTELKDCSEIVPEVPSDEDGEVLGETAPIAVLPNTSAGADASIITMIASITTLIGLISIATRRAY